MRLDKYLKVSRIIKRRTLAKEACEGGRVTINGREAKAGTEVKAGDKIEIRFGNNTLSAEITSVQEHVTKENAQSMYKILNETKN